jgi:hypothetical protein
LKPKGASVVSVLLTVPLIVSSAGPAGAASSTAAAAPGICASSSHPALAGRISRAVEAARRDRVSFVAVEVDDPGAGVVCRLGSQRWGVPAGAPRSLVVHVKNGWLPLAPHGWRINSIGGFTARSNKHSGSRYSIVVLTQDNPSMAYGVRTVEAIAEVVNRDLNPGATARVPASAISSVQETPDEAIP